MSTHTRITQYWNRHLRHYRKERECPEPHDAEWSDTDEFVRKGQIRLKEFELGGRDYAEILERRAARKQGRKPILPPSKYVFGDP